MKSSTAILLVLGCAFLFFSNDVSAQIGPLRPIVPPPIRPIGPPSFRPGISPPFATRSPLLQDSSVDPLTVLRMDRFTTKNFEIAVEQSADQEHPTAKEVGILVEKLCSQLDKIFIKYSPYNLAKTEEETAKEKNDTPKPQPGKKKEDANDKADPNRVIPQCKIFIFNDREGLLAKCAFDGIEPLGDGYAGFFTGKTNSVYLLRSPSLQLLRETILHEVTHFYTFNFLPGGWTAYPLWFHEGLAMTYQKHIWIGDKLIVGYTPRLEVFDNPASGLVGLARLRAYTKEKGAADDKDEAKGKSAKKQTTPVDPSLIQPFLNTEFTREILKQDGVVLKRPNEELAHLYAMYQVFGRFLIVSRPDLLGSILRQISQWENDKVKNPPRSERFAAAWKKVVDEKKPVSIEDVATWLQKNQLMFKWVFKDWQDLGDTIAGKAEEGQASVLLLRDPKMLPQFTISPKNPIKFQVGMVINFVDEDNFGVVCVNENGSVVLMEQRFGSWGIAKAVGKVAPNSGKNGPSYQFGAAQQGNVIRVSINKNTVGDFPRVPTTPCGFFIAGTEAIIQM